MNKLALIALALFALVAPVYAQTAATKTMTEYVVTSLNYYFLTSRDNEKTLLDANPAFKRTGYSFTVLATPVAGSAGITRYYFDQIAKAGTRGSHFYTLVAGEVTALNALNPGNASAPRLPQNESIDSYAYPAADDKPNKCDLDKEPIYRVFRGNSRFPDDANHRFTKDRALYLQLLAEGWEDEGVKFCAVGGVSLPPSSGVGNTYKGTFTIKFPFGNKDLELNNVATGTVTYKRSTQLPAGVTAEQVGNIEVFDAVEGSITQSVNETAPCNQPAVSGGPTTRSIDVTRSTLLITPATGSNAFSIPPGHYVASAGLIGTWPVMFTTISCSDGKRTTFSIDYPFLTFMTCLNDLGPYPQPYSDRTRLAGTCNNATTPGNGTIGTYDWNFTLID